MPNKELLDIFPVYDNDTAVKGLFMNDITKLGGGGWGSMMLQPTAKCIEGNLKLPKNV